MSSRDEAVKVGADAYAKTTGVFHQALRDAFDAAHDAGLIHYDDEFVEYDDDEFVEATHMEAEEFCSGDIGNRVGKLYRKREAT